MGLPRVVAVLSVVLVLPLLTFPLAAEAGAQQTPDTVALDEMVISATRLPQPRHAVPAAVTVITGDELRARGLYRLTDVLRTVVGTNLVSTGPVGSITSVFMRGGESDYVQVMIDGVTVNEPGGAYDFGHLSVQNVDRVEVVRGPVSVLYGTDAVAGVVQIFTRTGGPTHAVTATLEGGTFEKRGVTMTGDPASGSGQSLHADAGVAGGFGRVDYSLGVARDDNDGVMAVNNDYANTTGSARLRWSAPWVGATPLPARTDVAFTARVTDHTYHYPTNGAGILVDLNQHSTGLSTALGFEVGHFFSERFDARLGASRHTRDYEVIDQPDTPADTLGSYAGTQEDTSERTRVDARANLRLASAIVTLGGSAEKEEGTSDLLFLSSFGPFESSADYSRSTRAGFAQLVADAADRLTLTLGGRVDDSEKFGGFFTYRVGANLRVTESTTLRAALGTAFKEPTFYENFAEGFVLGNPDLEPEESRSGEVGALSTFARGSLGVTVFDQKFRNMIQYDPRPRAQRPDSANYFNLAEARARGVEAEVRLQPHERVALSAGWVILDTEVIEALDDADRAFAAGEPLLRRADQSGNLLATVRVTPALRASLRWSYVGGRDDLDFTEDFQGERVRLDAYSTVDLGGELDLVDIGTLGAITLTARVRNLLDEQYEEIWNFPALGRSLFLGVRAGGAR